LADFAVQRQRNTTTTQAHATACYSFKEIAQTFDLNYASISRVVKAA
jgi:hypothetical protein